MLQPNRKKVVALATLALLPAASWAAGEWRANPRVGLYALFEDNYTLSPTRKQSANSGVLDASVNLVGRYPTTTFSLQPRVRATSTRGAVDRSGTDGYLDLSLDHKGQKSTAGVNARFVDLALFRQYLADDTLTFGLGAISNTPDARALITADNRQRRLDVYPSSSFQLSERLRLNASAYLLDSSFARSSPEYVGFHNETGMLGLSFATTQRSNVTATLSGAQFTPKTGIKSNTYGLSVQWDNALSEIQRYYLRAGAERTKYGVGATAAARSGLNTTSFGAGVSWAWQVNGLLLDATRSVYPNASGAVAEQTELRGRFQHLFSQYVSAYSSVHAVEYKIVGTPTGADGSRTLYGNIGAEWRVTRQIGLTASVTYLGAKPSATARSASSNSVHLGFSWEPNRGAYAASISP